MTVGDVSQPAIRSQGCHLYVAARCSQSPDGTLFWTSLRGCLSVGHRHSPNTSVRSLRQTTFRSSVILPNERSYDQPRVPNASIRSQNRLRFITVETYKHVNHSTISEHKLIVDRVQLRVEGHVISTRAFRYLWRLNEIRSAAESMPASDVTACPLKWLQCSSLVVKRFRH